MNIPMLAFFMIWLAATLYLWARFLQFLRLRKRKKTCPHCKYYEVCEKVKVLKEQQLAQRITCSEFKKRGKL